MLVKNTQKCPYREKSMKKGTGKKEVRSVTCLRNCKCFLRTKRLRGVLQVVTEAGKDSDYQGPNILFPTVWFLSK